MKALSLDALADQTNSLRQAICVSLFTNDAHPESDVQPSWWANALSHTTFGSKLWSLQREKVTSETLELASLYAKEALLFLIQEGEASEIDVKARPIPKGLELQILILLKNEPDFRMTVEVPHAF